MILLALNQKCARVMHFQVLFHSVLQPKMTLYVHVHIHTIWQWCHCLMPVFPDARSHNAGSAAMIKSSGTFCSCSKLHVQVNVKVRIWNRGMAKETRSGWLVHMVQ